MSHFKKIIDRAFVESFEYIADSVYEYAKSSDGKLTVLDIGCGYKNRTKEFLSKVQKDKIGSIYGVDVVNRTKLKHKGMVYTELDLENSNLPYKSEKFDLIICNQVIEHLLNKDKTLEEAHRVLKKVGFFILGTENISTLDNILSLILGQEPINQVTSSKKRTNSILSADFMKDEGFDENVEKRPTNLYAYQHKNLCSYFGLQRLLEVNGLKVTKIKSFGNILKAFELLFPIYNRILIVEATKD